MAGPLSSEEIEDVVSSVRRLVSNEQRPRTRDLNAEKLVLTSAYRVMPEASPLSPLTLDAPMADAVPKHDVPPVAKDVAAADTAASTAALEDSLAQALALDVEPLPTGSDDARPSAPETPLVAVVEAEWEDEIWTEPGQVSLGEAALAAEEAEVLMAPEPDTDIIEAAADEPAVAALEAADGTWADEPIPFVPLRRRAEDLAARLAAGAVGDPSPASASAADTAEPEPSSVQDVSQGPVSLTGDEIPDDVPAEPANMAAVPSASASRLDQPHVATDFYDADGTPLAVLDETALNEIVRQVLRAELQGELGERITRNVRKLVRAEINRALLARDLD